MNFSASSQDYLEAILELSNERGQIRSIDLSSKLGVTRASVNRAIGVLKELGYVTQEKYSEILLTKEGRQAAEAVIIRHKTLKTFLIEVLGVTSEIAQVDACKMEHSISIETLEKLRSFMDKREKKDDKRY